MNESDGDDNNNNKIPAFCEQKRGFSVKITSPFENDLVAIKPTPLFPLREGGKEGKEREEGC